MTELPADILHCIGNTSLIALRHVAPANGARILLKLESENPTGSMKDRMARAAIFAAALCSQVIKRGKAADPHRE